MYFSQVEINIFILENKTQKTVLFTYNFIYNTETKIAQC